MTPEEVVAAVRRHHADRSHKRCWENDAELYRACGLEPGDPERPPIEEHRRACDQYRAELYGVPVGGEPCGLVVALQAEVNRLKELAKRIAIEARASDEASVGELCGGGERGRKAHQAIAEEYEERLREINEGKV